MTLLHGDCVEVMCSMPEDSVDAAVTDPPYFLRFMGRKWDHAPSPSEQQRQHQEWAREALRVLKPGGFLLASGGTRTVHRLTCAIEDAGFEIRDSITWIYGQGFPKSKSMKDIDRPELGTALKPAHESIVVARKPLSESSVARNVLEHGTGALNIDSARISHKNGHDLAESKAKNPGREDVVTSGVYGKNRPQQQVNEGGRWPANVILSHSPECQRVGVKRVRAIGGGNTTPPYASETTWNASETPGQKRKGYTDPDGFEEVEAWECVDGCPVAELDRQSGTSKSGGSVASANNSDESSTNTYGWSNGGINKSGPYHGGKGGASRFFYCAKASRRERGEGNSHPTVKPLALMRYLVKLVTPPGGVVLDPFAGSGSTLVAAIQEGFEAVGIEQDASYIEIAERRVAHARAEIESQPLALEV